VALAEGISFLGAAAGEGSAEAAELFQLPQAATNIIERCFVVVRRRARPMVTFVNIRSVNRIIFTIFNL
jgi:transposase-like protein